MIRTVIVALMLCAAVGGCAAAPPSAATADTDALAERYVRLVLAMGRHDPNYVDAYYGPAQWRSEATAAATPLTAIETQAQATLAALRAQPPAEEALLQLRQRYLIRQLEALIAHAQALQGMRRSFDAQARALYDIDPPRADPAALQAALARIDALLPGGGPLADRYNAYVERFAIPPARLEAVMRAAIEAARARTAEHLVLPPGERFELALVSNKSWSAYNWYQGDYRSRIEINVDQPITAARALELAVHEGYPGHHVYNSLLEQALVRGRGWVEYSVYPLYSPQSLIAEGTADYALALAYPLADRIALLRELIFPLAGFDPREAPRYAAIADAADFVGQATIDAARAFLDGEADAQATMLRLRATALASPGRAAQRVAFFRDYGAYIVNYALGEQRVADYVEAQAGGDPARRWAVFGELLASPRLPSDLRTP